MAISSFIDVSDLTYCGQEAGEIFSKDIYNLPLAEHITLMDGVKGKTKIYSGEIGDLFQPYTCVFDPNGEVVLTEDYVEPVEISAALEDCYDKFWPTFMNEQTRISMTGNLPQTFTDWFFAKFRQKLGREYDEIFWNAAEGAQTTKDYLKVTDGVIAQLETALSGAQSANLISGSAFTIDNILSQVDAAAQQAMASAAENEVDMENFSIFLNHNDARLLEAALGDCSNCASGDRTFNNYSRANGVIYIYGFPVVETVQERNTIIVGPGKNLIMAFDSYDSHLEYVFLDMRQRTADNSFRIRVLSNIGVGIVFKELFVLSKP